MPQQRHHRPQPPPRRSRASIDAADCRAGSAAGTGRDRLGPVRASGPIESRRRCRRDGGRSRPGHVDDGESAADRVPLANASGTHPPPGPPAVAPQVGQAIHAEGFPDAARSSTAAPASGTPRGLGDSAARSATAAESAASASWTVTFGVTCRWVGMSKVVGSLTTMVNSAPPVINRNASEAYWTGSRWEARFAGMADLGRSPGGKRPGQCLAAPVRDDSAHESGR